MSKPDPFLAALTTAIDEDDRFVKAMDVATHVPVEELVATREEGAREQAEYDAKRLADELAQLAREKGTNDQH